MQQQVPPASCHARLDSTYLEESASKRETERERGGEREREREREARNAAVEQPSNRESLKKVTSTECVRLSIVSYLGY